MDPKVYACVSVCVFVRMHARRRMRKRKLSTRGNNDRTALAAGVPVAPNRPYSAVSLNANYFYKSLTQREEEKNENRKPSSFVVFFPVRAKFIINKVYFLSGSINIHSALFYSHTWSIEIHPSIDSRSSSFGGFSHDVFQFSLIFHLRSHDWTTCKQKRGKRGLSSRMKDHHRASDLLAACSKYFALCILHSVHVDEIGCGSIDTPHSFTRYVNKSWGRNYTSERKKKPRKTEPRNKKEEFFQNYFLPLPKFLLLPSVLVFIHV